MSEGPWLQAWREKAASAAILLVYNVTGYMLLNHLPFASYRELPRVPVVDELQLIPWTILAYLSVYLLVGLAIAAQPGKEPVRRYLKASLIAFSATFVLFAAFPTRMERAPLPESGAMLWALRLTRDLDAPHTCCPSLHITNCIIPVLAVWGTRLRWWCAAWAVVIAASTLTTSQHTFLDLPAGAAMGGLGWALTGYRNGRKL